MNHQIGGNRRILGSGIVENVDERQSFFHKLPANDLAIATTGNHKRSSFILIIISST